jgi:hypothetical protein
VQPTGTDRDPSCTVALEVRRAWVVAPRLHAGPSAIFGRRGRRTFVSMRRAASHHQEAIQAAAALREPSLHVVAVRGARVPAVAPDDAPDLPLAGSGLSKHDERTEASSDDSCHTGQDRVGGQEALAQLNWRPKHTGTCWQGPSRSFSTRADPTNSTPVARRAPDRREPKRFARSLGVGGCDSPLHGEWGRPRQRPDWVLGIGLRLAIYRKPTLMLGAVNTTGGHRGWTVPLAPPARIDAKAAQ